MRGPALGLGDRVVEVAVQRRPVAAGPAAGQIPAAHKIRQSFRRHISRFRRGIARMHQRHQLGRVGQFRNEFGCDQTIGAHLGRGRGAGAVNRGVLGDHMNHHRRRRRPRPGRAVGTPTATAQPISPGRQRPQRISATLLTTARIVLTHRGRQRIQSRLESMRVGGEQAAVDLRNAAADVPDPDFPSIVALFAPPHRIRIGVSHDRVNLPGQPPLSHRRPARHPDGQLNIHRPQPLAVGDQIGAAAFIGGSSSVTTTTGFPVAATTPTLSNAVWMTKNARPCGLRDSTPTIPLLLPRWTWCAGNCR
jgi:hypothetical protein